MTRQGLSLSFVAAALGMQTSSAMRMMHRLRAHMHAQCEAVRLGGKGRDVWMLTNRTGLSRGPGGKGRRKVTLMGLWDGTQIYSTIIPHRHRNFMRPVLYRVVRPGSTIVQVERDYLVARHSKGCRIVGPDAPECFEPGASYLASYWINLIRSLRGTHILLNQERVLDGIKEHEFRHQYRRHPARMFEVLISSFPDISGPPDQLKMGIDYSMPASPMRRSGLQETDASL
ncbi:MAG: hypothetical protein R3E18_12400 [Sphingomonadaceae bacterium]